MPDTDTLRNEAIAAYRALFRQGEILHFATSFGKDSNTTLNLGIEAALQHRADGERVPPMLVVHADTGVENPGVRNYADEMISALESFSEREGLDVRVRVASPSLLDEMPVQVVSGRTLPVFANRSDRACTTDWKVRPADRAIRDLKAELAEEGYTPEPITVLGTRYEESAGRAARMNDRGEGAHVNEVRDEQGRVKARTFAPIADWSEEQVWEYLIMASGNGPYEAYAPSFEETIEIYKDASGECVFSMLGGAKQEASQSACGARHGCWSCTVAGGQDKSMQNMLEMPRHRYMRRLADLRNWMVATQNDYNIRRWVTRTQDPDTGYHRISPEAYSPETTRWLLAVMLSIDAEERDRAANLRELVRQGREGEDPGVQDIRAGGKPGSPSIERKGKKYLERMQRPQFQTISPEALIAIDYRWSMDAAHPPHEALRVWHEVIREGKRVFPPEQAFPVPHAPMPKPLWYEGSREAESPIGVHGPMAEIAGEGCGALYEQRTRKEDYTRPDGHTVKRETLNPDRVIAAREADSFHVDPESLELFWEFEIENRLAVNERFHAGESISRTEAAGWYLTYGLIGIAPGRAREAERQILRGRYWERSGLAGDVPLETIKANAITDAEHKQLIAKIRERQSQEQAVQAQDRAGQLEALSRRLPDMAPEQAERLLADRARMKAELPRLMARKIALESAQAQGVRYAEGEPVAEVRKRYARTVKDWERYAQGDGASPHLSSLYQRIEARVHARAAALLEHGEPTPQQFEWGFGIAMPFEDAQARAAEHKAKARTLDKREAVRWGRPDAVGDPRYRKWKAELLQRLEKAKVSRPNEQQGRSRRYGPAPAEG